MNIFHIVLNTFGKKLDGIAGFDRLVGNSFDRNIIRLAVPTIYARVSSYTIVGVHEYSVHAKFHSLPN